MTVKTARGNKRAAAARDTPGRDALRPRLAPPLDASRDALPRHPCGLPDCSALPLPSLDAATSGRVRFALKRSRSDGLLFAGRLLDGVAKRVGGRRALVQLLCETLLQGRPLDRLLIGRALLHVAILEDRERMRESGERSDAATLDAMRAALRRGRLPALLRCLMQSEGIELAHLVELLDAAPAHEKTPCHAE